MVEIWFSLSLQVRIEDDVLITANGCECLTDVPRTVDDIEQHMALGKQSGINVLL